MLPLSVLMFSSDYQTEIKQIRLTSQVLLRIYSKRESVSENDIFDLFEMDRTETCCSLIHLHLISSVVCFTGSVRLWSYWVHSSVPPSLQDAWAVPAQVRPSVAGRSNVWRDWSWHPSPRCWRTEAGRRGGAWCCGGLNTETWISFYCRDVHCTSALFNNLRRVVLHYFSTYSSYCQHFTLLTLNSSFHITHLHIKWKFLF